jgi:type VI secretion system protein ImpA
MATDIDMISQPIRPDAPCGDDLEYDPAFTELERISRGGGNERAVGHDVPTEGPDWRAIRAKAAALLERTKDLRVAVVWTKALLHIDGMRGFAAGMSGLRALLEGYWDTLHPQLSAEDGNNPLMRLNVLKELCDRDSVVNVVRAAPLVSLPALGSFSLRDIAIASGELTPTSAGEGAPPDMARIDAAFANCELTQLQAVADAVQQAAQDARAIEAYVTDKAGPHNPLSLEDLRTLLARGERALASQLQKRGVGVEGANGHGGAMNGEAHPGGGRSIAVGSIGSRADVVRVLGQICEYYAQNEPSSPIPILLRRAQRLVSMSFLDIVRELAPAGMSEIENIRGPQDADN